MPSIYASQVEAKGRHWYRPWCVLAFAFAVCAAMNWLTSPGRESISVCLAEQPDSRFQSRVELEGVPGLKWTADLRSALRCAREHDRLVFVDVDGIVNINCRDNHLTVFSRKEVRAALKQHVLVILYTDLVPDEYYRTAPTRNETLTDARANLEFQKKTFDTEQNPLYALLRPVGDDDFQIVGIYEEARINDVQKFVRFLREPQHRRR